MLRFMQNKKQNEKTAATIFEHKMRMRARNFNLERHYYCIILYFKLIKLPKIDINVHLKLATQLLN